MTTRDELIAALMDDEPKAARPTGRHPFGLLADAAMSGPARGVAQALIDTVALPGRAMDQGITTEGAVPWGADMALNMAGVGAPFAQSGALGSAGGKGIRAYHGSPHDFDRFDMSRIGTGEGAQAYGHGLYFAENEGVAKAYRDALSRQNLPAGQQQDMAQWAFTAARGDIDAAKAKLRDGIARYEREGWPTPEYRNQYDEGLRKLERGDVQTPGKMYEVNINARPEQFLDWDKPLSGQGRETKRALTEGIRHSNNSRRMMEKDPLGADFYHWFRESPSSSPQHTSQEFREAGIPGIKYLDEGSRGNWTVRENPKGFYGVQGLDKGVGGNMSEYFPTRAGAEDWVNQQKTSNYVVFDDKLIDILRKYGLMGAAPIPAASAVANALMEPQSQ